MKRVVIRIEDLNSHRCEVYVDDYSWYEWDDDSWQATRSHAIGRDNHGSWTFLAPARRLNLWDSSGLVMTIDRIRQNPSVGDSGEGLHNTPGKHIEDGVVSWEVTAIR